MPLKLCQDVIAWYWAVPASAQEQTSVPMPLAITNVTIVDLAAGTLSPHQTVLIRDGRITALAPTSAVAVPADARQIDGWSRHGRVAVWAAPGDVTAPR